MYESNLAVPSLFFQHAALIAKEKVSQALSHFQTIIFMVALGIHSRATRGDCKFTQ